MKIVVTCGPSFEPIDEVRRITNFSTGELGILLANRLARDGHEVTLCKGVAATCPLAVERARVVPFTTNDDLRDLLTALPWREKVAAFFHAAALSDFKISRRLDDAGNEVALSKIPSTMASLQLLLEPAAKLISELRGLFPKSKIIGWKYELAGTRDEAIANAVEQIRVHQTDACVVNGAAYGKGFGICGAGGLSRHVGDKTRLCDELAALL